MNNGFNNPNNMNNGFGNPNNMNNGYYNMVNNQNSAQTGGIKVVSYFVMIIGILYIICTIVSLTNYEAIEDVFKGLDFSGSDPQTIIAITFGLFSAFYIVYFYSLRAWIKNPRKKVLPLVLAGISTLVLIITLFSGIDILSIIKVALNIFIITKILSFKY